MKKTHKIIVTQIYRGAMRSHHIYKKGGEYVPFLVEDKTYEAQRMVIVSNDIREGDYVVDLSSWHVHRTTWDYELVKGDPDFRRILASNNYYGCVPNIPESFIKEWCENPVEEAIVEHDCDLFEEPSVDENGELKIKMK